MSNYSRNIIFEFMFDKINREGPIERSNWVQTVYLRGDKSGERTNILKQKSSGICSGINLKPDQLERKAQDKAITTTEGHVTLHCFCFCCYRYGSLFVLVCSHTLSTWDYTFSSAHGWTPKRKKQQHCIQESRKRETLRSQGLADVLFF